MLSAGILMICRMTTALLFALSFTGKVRDVKTFQEAVVDFRVLPANLSRGAAWVFLVAECATCLMMVIGGSLLPPGFLLAIALLLLFSIALVLILRRKRKVSCNCFGWTDQRVSAYDVARNTLFILCALLGLWADAGLSANLSGSDILLLGFLAVCLVVLATNLTDIVATLRRPFRVFLTE